MVVFIASTSIGKYGVDYIQLKIFYADLAASHPIRAFFLAAPQRYW